MNWGNDSTQEESRVESMVEYITLQHSMQSLSETNFPGRRESPHNWSTYVGVTIYQGFQKDILPHLVLSLFATSAYLGTDTWKHEGQDKEV